MFQVPLAGQALSSANIGIDTTITSGNISCTNISATNGTINNLTTTIFNPASITTDTVDTANLTVTNSIPVLNIQTLNVSTKNVSQMNVINISASNMSVDNISCTSFTSPDVQPLLIAGDNVSILNNVINVTNDALLPSNANFSSINTSSLVVNNTVVIGGTCYLTDLIVSDVINCSTIQANNLSTAEMQFGNSLAYVAVAKVLEVNTTDTISSGNTLPVTSGAVYNAINTSTTTISTMWSYMLSETEFKLVASSVASGGENTICYLDITPQYEGSKIHVDFCFSYSVGGFGTDSIITEIRVGKNNNTSQTVIQELFQEWTNGSGGGTRSGASGSISASYQNTDTLGKYHRIQLRVDNNSDDSWGLTSVDLVSIKVIEFIETAGTSNPNILIGSGNISCGNLSCTTLTATNHTIDNLITTENVNVGGSMVTVGFPESGVIVPSSMVRLAGGSAVLNYADMAWDGTTFNISTRQSTKNFKVSFGQVAYLEVDSTNVSVQSLRVNQGLEVLGTLTYNDLILNDSLLLNGTFSAFGATFRDDVVFERDVDIEQTLNVSNINVSGNVVVAGTITGSNISTAALIPGTNITITNNVISAFVQSDADIVVSSLHVDNDVDIYGVLNVSETSNFGQSLNVDNQLFVGKAGTTNGDVVLYSTNVGDNFEIQNGNTETSFLGTGNISRFNFSLLGNQTLTIKPTQVNISGDLIVSGNITGTLDFENLSVTNLSVVNLTVDLIQGDLNAENILCDTVTTTGHVETGKWLVGASSTTTASLYNKDITSVTTHYALHQTDGGATSLNGTAVYFKNNGTDVGEWTATGLGVGKTTPTTTLDVLGNTLITGNVNICGILDADDIVLDNISNTNFSGANMTATELVVPLLSNVSFITSTGMIEFTTNGSPTLDLDELSSKFYHDVNISGTLTADAMANINCVNASFTNVSATNLTVATIGNFSTQNISATTLSTTGKIETGKWLIGASSSTTASLYNTDITSVTTDYALRQTDGGATSLNGTAVYFKNNGTDVGGWTSTGLGVGKTTPTKKLDVLGNSLFTGDMNVCGSIYSDNVSSTIVNTPLVTSNILDLDGTERILFNIDNVPMLELIEDELYLYVDCIAQTMDVQQKLDGLNMSMTNISTARLTSTNTSVTNLSATNITATTINTGDVTATGTIDTFELIADESTINFLTVSSNFTTDEVLCDYVHATVSILCDGPLVVTGVTTLSGKVNISNDMNISGQLEAETFVGTLQTSVINVPTINVSTLNVSDLLNNTEIRTPLMNASTINASSVLITNISTSNLSADETSSNHINCSTLTILDTGGAGGLDVTGAAYFRGSSFFVYETSFFEADSAFFGQPAGNSTKSIINFWSQQAATEVGVRFGCDSDDIVRLKLEKTGLYTHYNINISNVSTMDMDNTSTKFHQNVNISGTLTADNISTTNLSCNELTTSDAVGSTSVISGFQINKLSNNVTRLLSDDDTALLSYNTNTGICAYQGENQVEFRIDGTALLTCKSAGVRIGDDNTPTEILDVNGNALISGELTASLINSHQNWMRFGSPGATVFTTGTTFFDLTYTATSSDARKTNTSLITQNANGDEFTIVKAGYYRFFSQCGVYNNTYTDRLTWRVQPVVNGAQSNNYSHLFCYTRHNQYGNRGTVNGEVLRLFAVGDTVRMRLDVGKASFGSNFGSDMGGISINGGAYIEINYLGN